MVDIGLHVHNSRRGLRGPLGGPNQVDRQLEPPGRCVEPLSLRSVRKGKAGFFLSLNFLKIYYFFNVYLYF